MSSTTFLLIAMSLIVEYPVNQAQPVSPEHQWPAQCVGKSYCEHKPNYYPEQRVKDLIGHVAMEFRFGDMENRDGSNEDVGSCGRKYGMKQIYLIKDKNDKIRFVPQTEKFNIHVAVEECKNPGRVKYAEYLDKLALENNRVNCVQTMVPFVFPVLSRDEKSLEPAKPKGGISLGCSAKIMKPE